MTVKIPVEADLSGATSSVAAFRQEIARTQAALKGGEFEVNTGGATQKLKALVSSADALRTALDKANDKRIGVDTSAAESALTDTRSIAAEAEEELRRLSGKKVGIDIRDAKRALQELKHLIGDARYGGSGGVLGRSVDDAKKLDQYMTRVRRTQEFLSKNSKRPVSQAQAERFVEEFAKRQKSDAVLRRFSGVADWFDSETGESTREKREMLRRIGRQGGGIPGMRTAGMQRFAGALGGAVGGMTAGAGDGGFFGNVGNMAGTGAGMGIGALVGGPVGAIVGAFAGSALGGALGGVGRQIDQAMTDALSEAIDTANLRRALGETSVEFNRLRDVTRAAGAGFGVAVTESTKMARQFAQISNYNGSAEGFGAEIHHGIGFSRGFGIDPGAGNNFFAQMRNTGASRNEQDNRRMASYMAEAIGRGRMFAKTDEVLQAVTAFTQQATQVALRSPAAGAYASLLATGVAEGIPGLNVGNAAGIIGAADSSMRKGGAFGDASKMVMMSALSKGQSGMSVFDIRTLMEGGLFGTGEEAFGRGSISYKRAEARGDTEETRRLDALAKSMGGRTNLSRFIEELKGYSGSDPMYVEQLANSLGLSKDQAAAFDLMNLKDPGLGGLQKKFGDLGINLQSVDPSAWASIAQIQTGGEAKWKKLAQRIRKGDGYRALSDDERKSLDAAEKEGGTGFQNELLRLVSKRGMQMTEGDKALQTQVDLKNAFVGFAGAILPISTAAKDGILALVQKLAPDSDYAQEIKERKFEAAKFEAGIGGLGGIERAAKEFEAKGDHVSAAKYWGQYNRRLSEIKAKAQTDPYISQKFRAKVSGMSAHEVDPAAGPFIKGAFREPPEAVKKAAAQSPVGGLTAEREAKLLEQDKKLGVPSGTTRAQWMQESGMRGDAVSRAGAEGWAQIMPKTRSVWEKRLGKSLDPFDFDDALTLHYHTMRENLGKFKNVEGALSAYNGGWDPRKWGNKETSEYVPKIMAHRDRWLSESGQIPGFDDQIPEEHRSRQVATGPQRMQHEHTFVFKDAKGNIMENVILESTKTYAAPLPAGV